MLNDFTKAIVCRQQRLHLFVTNNTNVLRKNELNCFPSWHLKQRDSIQGVWGSQNKFGPKLSGQYPVHTERQASCCGETWNLRQSNHLPLLYFELFTFDKNLAIAVFHKVYFLIQVAECEQTGAYPRRFIRWNPQSSPPVSSSRVKSSIWAMLIMTS